MLVAPNAYQPLLSRTAHAVRLRAVMSQWRAAYPHVVWRLNEHNALVNDPNEALRRYVSAVSKSLIYPKNLRMTGRVGSLWSRDGLLEEVAVLCALLVRHGQHLPQTSPVGVADGNYLFPSLPDIFVHRRMNNMAFVASVVAQPYGWTPSFVDIENLWSILCHTLALLAMQDNAKPFTLQR